MCIHIYIYIYIHSFYEWNCKTFAVCLCLDEMGPATPSATDFGQIWHDIDFNFTNTYKHLKTNNNFSPKSPESSSLLLSLPHPMFVFHDIWSWPFFSTCSAFRMVQAFEQRHTFSPEYLPTSPPPSPAAWVVQHRDRDPVQSNKKNNGEALEKVTCWSWSPKLGGEGMRVAAM